MKHGRLKLIFILTALILILGGCAAKSEDSEGQKEQTTKQSPSKEEMPSQEETVIKAEGNVTEVDLSGMKGTVYFREGGVYRLSGKLKQGQLVIDAGKNDDVELILAGVSVTSTVGAALYCRNADNLVITLQENTENSLTDAGKYYFDDPVKEEPNAALFSKADLTIRGEGSLTVEANYKHGISTKDDLVISGGVLSVTSASDALRGKDSVLIEGGSIRLKAGKDGIAATNDLADQDEEKGWIEINGGTFDITASGDAVQAETRLTISDGSFAIVTEGAASGNKGSQKGLKAKELLQIYGGSYQLTVNDDAVHSSRDALITGGDFTIDTTDDGVHADNDLVIQGGSFDIPVCYEGIEGTTVTIDGGTFFISSVDDAIGGAAGTEEAKAQNVRSGNPLVWVKINGGEIEAYSGGDTVDSNGDIFVNGGKLRLTSPSEPYYEGVLLCNGQVTVTGGDLVLAGNIGVGFVVEKQPMIRVSFRDDQKAGGVLTLKDAQGNVLQELVTRKIFNQAAFASPSFVIGETYTVYLDGQKVVDVTLTDLLTKTGADGGPFTRDYPRDRR